MLLFDDSKKLEKALGEEAAAVIAHVAAFSRRQPCSWPLWPFCDSADTPYKYASGITVSSPTRGTGRSYRHISPPDPRVTPEIVSSTKMAPNMLSALVNGTSRWRLMYMEKQPAGQFNIKYQYGQNGLMSRKNRSFPGVALA